MKSCTKNVREGWMKGNMSLSLNDNKNRFRGHNSPTMGFFYDYDMLPFHLKLYFNIPELQDPVLGI